MVKRFSIIQVWSVARLQPMSIIWKNLHLKMEWRLPCLELLFIRQKHGPAGMAYLRPRQHILMLMEIILGQVCKIKAHMIRVAPL